MMTMNDNSELNAFTVDCKYCGVQHVIILPEIDIYKWAVEGELIQNAFPYLCADVRELMISNTCGECWDKFYGSSDE
jgi:hypothetical protein